MVEVVAVALVEGGSELKELAAGAGGGGGSGYALTLVKLLF